jgi:hypothetical protein
MFVSVLCLLALALAFKRSGSPHLQYQSVVYHITTTCTTSRKKAIYKTAGGIIASILKLVHTKTWRYTYVNHYSHTCTCICVDGVYSYQTSYGFASGQILRRSQGTLLPSSGEPKVSNPWNNVQCKDSI